MIQEGAVAQQEFGGGHGVAPLRLDFEDFQAALAAGDQELALDQGGGARGRLYGFGARPAAEDLEQPAVVRVPGQGRWAR